MTMNKKTRHQYLKAWIGAIALGLIGIITVILLFSATDDPSIVTDGIKNTGIEESQVKQTDPADNRPDNIVDQIAPVIVDDPVIYNHAFDHPAVMSGAVQPAWQKWSVQTDTKLITGDDPLIAIVIDDIGPARHNSLKAIDLAPPLTLAFLPYAERVKPLVKSASQRGHEIMLHMPMEPMDLSNDPGPGYLRAGDDPIPNLIKNLSAMDGYIGINNHMGSRFTSDKKAMGMVLSELQKRQLLFLDSRTTADSVVPDWIATHPDQAILERDIFLDHHRSVGNITDSLQQLERIARDHGTAVGIGHPYPETIAALTTWRDQLGPDIHLVPLSAIYMRRMEKHQ